MTPKTLADFRALLADLPTADAKAIAAAEARNGVLTKPPGALGQLEHIAIWLAGFDVYKKGLTALRHGRLNINALMTVAVTGAFLIGQWPEAAMVMALYAAAERIEVGNRVTEADWRLFTTAIRFDAVYHGHFKCNLRRIEDYPNLSN